jgi:hypothetical protein
MKTPLEIFEPMKSAALRFLISAMVLCGASVSVLAGVSDEKPLTMDEMVVNETKTHTLFMGCDIAINLDEDLYPVRDVFGSNWVVDINGQQKEISSRQAPLNLKITPTLKLTEVSATILGFKKEAAYSFDNDPSVRITKGLTHSASMSADLQANGENALNRVDTMTNKDMAGFAMFAGSDDQFSSNAMLTTAKYLYSDLHSNKVGPGGVALTAGTAPTAVGDPLDLGGLPGLSTSLRLAAHNAGIAAAADLNQSKNGNEPSGHLATQGLDALEIEFDIAASKPLYNPYVVTIARYRTPGAKPGSFQNLVYARAIDPIDKRLYHVHFTEDGFPFNYELLDFQLHIYNRGVEIATNISPNRVELTRDEAFEYVMLEYLNTHRGSTLPAVPAMGQLPADLPTRLAAGKYSLTFYVRVSKDGLAKEAYLDAACTKKIDDPYLTSVVSRIRFKPALVEGKAVEAVAPLNLNKLTI